MIKIRKATVKDKETLIRTVLKIEQDADSQGFLSIMASTRDNAELLYAMVLYPSLMAGDPILFAEQNGNVIGASFTLIRRGPIACKSPSAYGSGWWVDPEYRRKGILKDLLAETERLLRAAGIFVWEEFIHEPNHLAFKIAEKRGFMESMVILRKELR